MKLTKAIFLVIILVLPIASSIVISFDDDATLYELLESTNEEGEEDDAEKTHHNCDFFLQNFDKAGLYARQDTLHNYYLKNRIFQSIQPEVLTPPPRNLS